VGEVEEGTVEVVDCADWKLASLPLELGDLGVLERPQEGEGSGGSRIVQ
jgi:hypothetical protein